MDKEITRLLGRYPELAECESDIRLAFETIKTSFERGGKLLLAGNGGSAADCDHVVGELMKGFMSPRPIPLEEREKLALAYGADEGAYLADRLQGALPAVSLTAHASLSTAFANDVAADMTFAQQVYGYGKPGDTLAVFSTSGNSANVVRAAQVAKARGLSVVGFTGAGGGKLVPLCDALVRVPSSSTPEIQERHLPIYHTLCVMLERAFF